MVSRQKSKLAEADFFAKRLGFRAAQSFAAKQLGDSSFSGFTRCHPSIGEIVDLSYYPNL